MRLALEKPITKRRPFGLEGTRGQALLTTGTPTPTHPIQVLSTGALKIRVSMRATLLEPRPRGICIREGTLSSLQTKRAPFCYGLFWCRPHGARATRNRSSFCLQALGGFRSNMHAALLEPLISGVLLQFSWYKGCSKKQQNS